MTSIFFNFQSSLAFILFYFISISPVAMADATPASLPSKFVSKELKISQLTPEGKIYSLAISTNRNTPIIGDRKFDLEVISATGPDHGSIGKNKLSGHDDRVSTANGIGTQIDGLAHVGIDGIHYNGVTSDEIFHPQGVRKYGTETIQPIVARGIVLNIAALKQTTVLADDYKITPADLIAALKRQSLSLRQGDVVLLHTGWLATVGGDAKRFLATSPGLNKEAARYLSQFKVTAVGADNWGVETVPAEDEQEIFPVHQILLAENGIFILENIWTQELADDQINEFLFVLGVPRLQGGVQGIVHPVAIH
jgi:kynurenine formamidase